MDADGGGRGRGVSVRCARKWVGRYRLEGEPVCLIAPRRRGGSRIAPPGAGRGDREAARLRFTAAEIAETLGMALSTVSGILTRLGHGPARPARARAAVRYERSRPGELVHIDVKKLGRIQGGAGSASAADRAALQRRCTDRDGRRRVRSAGSTSTSRRRLQPPRLRRGARRRESHHRGRLPPPRSRLLPTPRHPGRTLLTDNGSAYVATIHALACRHTRHPPPPHPPLPATNKRQSRTLHPHPAHRLGLRRHLPLKQRTHRRP